MHVGVPRVILTEAGGAQHLGQLLRELERGHAQTALKGEQQLRGQLEKDLAQTQRRLEAAEKARDAAIRSLEQAAVRGIGTGRRAPRS